MLRAVLFDVDGTLVDSNHFHVLAWAEAFHGAGHDFRFSELHAQIGQGADNFVRALVPGVSDDDALALADAHKQLFLRHYASRLQPLPGARDLLLRCKAEGLCIVLATSASEEELDRNLAVLDAEDMLDGQTDADEVRHSKPCPDLIKAALRRADAAPSEAILIGDTPYDIEAALGAGVATIALRSGMFPDEALRGAIAIYDDCAALLADFDDSPLNRASSQE